MNKKRKKLALSSETLRSLTAPDLGEAVGGATSATVTECSGQCTYCTQGCTNCTAACTGCTAVCTACGPHCN
jgi:hypothetical protein